MTGPFRQDDDASLLLEQDGSSYFESIMSLADVLVLRSLSLANLKSDPLGIGQKISISLVLDMFLNHLMEKQANNMFEGWSKKPN